MYNAAVYDQIVLSVITVMELYQGMGNKIELAQMKRRSNIMM